METTIAAELAPLSTAELASAYLTMIGSGLAPEDVAAVRAASRESLLADLGSLAWTAYGDRAIDAIRAAVRGEEL